MGRMTSLIITGLLLVLCVAPSLQQISRCLLSREDYLLCKYQNSALERADKNQYSVHHTRLRQSRSGYLECNVRAKEQDIRSISNLGTEALRILYSPGFILGVQYDNQLRTEYVVQCEEGELAFFNVTFLNLQSEEDCLDDNDNFRCQDYLQIIRGSFGTTDSCGSVPSDDAVVQLEFADYTAVFRTSEQVRGEGFEMYSICFRPVERNLEGCYNVSEFTTGVCSSNASVPMPTTTPTPAATVAPTTTTTAPPTTTTTETTTATMTTETTMAPTTDTTTGTDVLPTSTTTTSDGPTSTTTATTTSATPTTTPPPNSKRSAGEEEVAMRYSDLFPGYPDHLMMPRDLANFHHQWNRVKRADSNAQFVTLNILFNQTVYYSDNTILIFGPDSATAPVKEIPDVLVLQTFDPTGKIDYHFGQFMGERDPHFQTAGPLKVIGRHAYFQLFVIDPRGILPTEEEQEELVAMTTALLASVPLDDDRDPVDPDQIEGDLRGIPGIRGRRQTSSADLTDMDRESVLSALRNEEACNPVLRAQARATLTYYTSNFSDFVNSLRVFDISCSVLSANTVLQCTTASTTLPGRTICQVDNLDPFPCEPFGGEAVALEPAPISTVTVSAINCLGQRALQVLNVPNLAP